jgi:hypothetical protein
VPACAVSLWKRGFARPRRPLGPQLVVDVVDEALRPVELDRLGPADQDSQQMVKADEMIDMRVRDEKVLQAMDLSHRQRRNITKVKQDRTPFKQRFDIERRVSKSIIDEAWVQDRPHNDNTSSIASLAGFVPYHDSAHGCDAGRGFDMAQIRAVRYNYNFNFVARPVVADGEGQMRARTYDRI